MTYHYRVKGVNSVGTTYGNDGFFTTSAAAPAVSSVSPTNGSTAGGTSVTIKGTNFTGATAVKFGSANATSYTVVSATQIIAVAPAGTAGIVDITVTTAGGTSGTGASDKYTYVAAPTVSSVSPTNGSTAGGTSVIITGTNFIGVTAVKFGSNTASYTVNSATQITAAAPAGAAGTVDITVTSASGISGASVSDQYTYTAAPTTYTLTYTAGVNGSITGTALQTVNSGTTGSAVTAVPNAGYHFVSWSDGVNTATRTDSNVIANISLTANFAADTPTPPIPPTPEQTTVKGDVIDQNGTSVKGVEAKVSTETNGNKIVEVKSSEAVLLKQPDGTNSTLSDVSKLSFSNPVTTNNGSTSANTASVTLKADGTIQVNNLPKGTETKFDVTLDLGNGRKIIIGCIDVKVSSNGDVSLTSTLIDPYGTITDKTTGKIITGANVKLYYANTARNIAAGKTPDTLVPLPLIDGFKPNDNKNPQISDASGAYGFMVFPNSDYYIVATKAGYEDFKSPTISVEKEIVKYDIQMTPAKAAMLVQTGYFIDRNMLIFVGIVFMTAGFIFIRKKRA